jgi:protein required for attachment to host cells
MILPKDATVAVADGEMVRLFHNNKGVKPGVHLVEISEAPPAPAQHVGRHLGVQPTVGPTQTRRRAATM